MSKFNLIVLLLLCITFVYADELDADATCGADEAAGASALVDKCGIWNGDGSHCSCASSAENKTCVVCPAPYNDSTNRINICRKSGSVWKLLSIRPVVDARANDVYPGQYSAVAKAVLGCDCQPVDLCPTSDKYAPGLCGCANPDPVTFNGTGVAQCNLCGNGKVDSYVGEQCDGGPCCSSTCTFIPDGTTCDSSSNKCVSGNTCRQGSCSGGKAVNCGKGTCNPADGTCSCSAPYAPPKYNVTATTAPKASITMAWLYTSDASDLGFTRSFEVSRVQIEKDYGTTVDTQFVIISVPQSQTCPQSCVDQVNAYLKKGMDDGRPFDVAVMAGSAFIAQTPFIAANFSSIKFLQSSRAPASWSAANNLAVFYGWYEQGRYLTGFTSGLMTKTNKICYITVNGQAQVWKQTAAFAQGVYRANPDAQIYWIKSQSFGVPSGDRNATYYMIDPAQGYNCDVIGYQSLYAVSASVACERGLISTGYGSDIRYWIGDSVMTSLTVDFVSYFHYKIDQILAGKWADREIWVGGVTEGTIQLGSLSPRLPIEVSRAVNNLYTQMKGCYNPFCGPQVAPLNVNPTNSDGCITFAQSQLLSDTNPGSVAPFINLIDLGDYPKSYQPPVSWTAPSPACNICPGTEQPVPK